VVWYVGDGNVGTSYLLIHMLFTVTIVQLLVAGQLSHVLVKFQSLTHMSRMLSAFVLSNLWFILANDQCITLGVELCIFALYSLSLASTFIFMPALLGTPVAEEGAIFGYFVPADRGGRQE
jgi:hypothetical protein